MLEGRKNIFIVGIGGIGVSGLARLLRARGVEVSGSDLEQSPITEALAREVRRVDRKALGRGWTSPEGPRQGVDLAPQAV